MVSDSSAPAGVAPLAARSERFTVTSFQPTLAGGSCGRKWTPSAIVSWVITNPSSTATSSSRPRASGAVAIRRRRAITSDSRIRLCSRRASSSCNGVQEPVDEAALALVVKAGGARDIFRNNRRNRNMGPGDQLVGPGAEARAHRPVEPLQGPALGETVADQLVDLGAPGVHAGNNVVEKVALRIVIAIVLDRRSEAMVVELLQQPGQGRALHLLLVKRLDGGEARRRTRTGTGTGTGLGHAAGAVASASAARKGSSAAATSAPASHGAKWPASGRRSIERSSTSSSRPSSWSDSSAASFIPQMTNVGTFTLGNARNSQSGMGTVTPGGGTITRDPRYQLSIALHAPG